jgi:hypothetical protein
VQERDGCVTRAYLTSVGELREICEDLSDGNHEYRIVRCDEKEVTISYTDGNTRELNTLCFAFPILPYIWPYGLPAHFRLIEETTRVVCLHVLVGRRVKSASHPQGEQVWKNGIADWERFWPHLETALLNRLESRNLLAY